MKKMGFEESVRRLEEVAGLLERGDLPLEDSMKLYAEGVKLVQSSQKLLDEAEQKVTLLSGGGETEFHSEEPV
jgi:exodeoxyribonuclease VII small subunit